MQKILAFLLCLLPGLALAQGKLTGVVQDSATHQPLAFASVFLANTTLGATTTEQGEFVFPKVPAGSYELVGSYVGYNLSKQSITIGKAAAPQSLTLRLSASGPALDEVVIHASPHSQEDYDKFSGLFWGKRRFRSSAASPIRRTWWCSSTTRPRSWWPRPRTLWRWKTTPSATA